MTQIVNNFPVWLRNRLLSAGLEPFLSQIEKACILYSIELQTFSTNIKIKIIKLKPSFVSRDKIFHFDIRGKLSIIRCDKYIFKLIFCP